MPDLAEFQYLILRVMPSLERGERMNAGVVVYCQRREYLDARVGLDRDRLAALTGGTVDPDEVAVHLRALQDVAEGLPSAGALGAMTASQRFGWLAAPASTVIQPSPVHTGLTHDPARTLEKLFAHLVAAPDR